MPGRRTSNRSWRSIAPRWSSGVVSWTWRRKRPSSTLFASLSPISPPGAASTNGNRTKLNGESCVERFAIRGGDGGHEVVDSHRGEEPWDFDRRLFHPPTEQLQEPSLVRAIEPERPRRRVVANRQERRVLHDQAVSVAGARDDSLDREVGRLDHRRMLAAADRLGDQLAVRLDQLVTPC
jgi:hypothetical protein